MNVSDRRFASRFKAAVPFRFNRWNSAEPEESAQSINISKSGIYFESESPPATGTALRLTLAIPEEITGLPAMEWICLAHVVRLVSVSRGAGRSGVAVRIDYFEYLRKEEEEEEEEEDMHSSGPFAAL
jgi:hypothetical protein